MKFLSVKSIVMVPLMFAIVNCTAQTADVYTLEKANFSAETRDEESITLGQAAQPESFETPDFPSVVKMTDSYTYTVQPLTEVDPADIFDVKQVISLTRQDEKPKLDLLFVIDDSRSMTDHQERLKQNMDKFVKGLNSDILDYRIGVSTIYDTGRYFNPVSEFRRTEPKGRNFERMGRLLPLKGVDGDSNSPRFVTPDMDTKILADTLKVGAKTWVPSDIYKDLASGEEIELSRETPEEDLKAYNTFIENFVLIKEATGPLEEELLNPMVMALFPESLLTGSSSNKDIYRKHFPPSTPGEGIAQGLQGDDAEEAWKTFAQNYNGNFVREEAHLGVIFVTDTIDNSNVAGGMNSEVAAQRLIQLKKDDNFDRISTYGVLHKNTVSKGLQRSYPKEWSRRHCTVKNGAEARWKSLGCDNPAVDNDDALHAKCELLVDTDNDVRGIKSYENPQELEKFLNLTRGNKIPGANILNLCSGGDGTSDSANNSYGKNLAKIASELFVKSVGVGTYSLDAIPVGDIKVYFAGEKQEQILGCPKAKEGELCWVTQFNSGSLKVILRNQHKLTEGENVSRDLIIDYKGIDPKSATVENSKRSGQ